MMTHPNESQLNEFVDGTLAPDAREQVAAHLASCLTCAASVRRIESIVERARALPRDVAPPKEAWNEVRAAVRAASSARQVRPIHSPRRWLLAAAAAVLVVGVGTTIAVMRQMSTPSIEQPVAVGSAPPARLAEFAPVEARYVLAAAELQETLEERREMLHPETIAIIESSLTTIDSAIAEARTALANDPGNPTISYLLASSYEQKVALLRRATELQPRS